MTISTSMPPMASTGLQIRLPSYAHNAIAYSPFDPDRLAVASGTNFGLSGKGAIHVLRKVDGPQGKGLRVEKRFETPDCAFDLAWSENHPDHVLVACGDGSCLLYDATLTSTDVRPRMTWRGHSKEVFGIDSSNLDKTKFASCSWDGSVVLWDTSSPAPLRTLRRSADIPSECVYTCLFSPHLPHIIGSTTSTGRFVLYDLRAPTPCVLDAKTHEPETLTFDWNKYQPDLVATGGVDATVKVWDLRQAQAGPSQSQIGQTNELRGHKFAVKRVQWSPFERNLLASSSYDMTCRVWNIEAKQSRDPHITTYARHREFLHGLAWSMQDRNELATASWDQSVHIVRIA